MHAQLHKREIVRTLMQFLMAYLNVILTFSFIYLLLDILNLGTLVDTYSFLQKQELFVEKIIHTLHLSTAILFLDDYGQIINPIGLSKVVSIVQANLGFIIPAFILVKFSLETNAMEKSKATPFFRIVRHAFFVTIGALFVAFGLENFLVPNNIIDGGIVGVSIILSYLTGLKLEFYILLLNLPFLVLGYKQIGKVFVLTTLFGICVLSLGTSVLKLFPVITENPLLASLLGGACLGIGVGLVIRYGGSLDGTEILAILFNRISRFSVGNVVMFINVFIFASAGFVFGWRNALHSLIAYFIAFKMIDVTISGFDIKGFLNK